MQRITPSTNRRLHKLLNQTGLSDHKPELVKQYSEIDSPSSRDLLETEARQLCKHLQAELDQYTGADKQNQMRRKIISMLRAIGFEKEHNGRSKADMKAIYSFIKNRGYLAPKPFNEYNADELPKLVTQIETFTRNRAQEFNRHTRAHGQKER